MDSYKVQLKEAMSEIVAQFKTNCNKRMEGLRAKHRRELHQLAKCKRQAEGKLVQACSINRDNIWNRKNTQLKCFLRLNNSLSCYKPPSEQNKTNLNLDEIETMV